MPQVCGSVASSGSCSRNYEGNFGAFGKRQNKFSRRIREMPLYIDRGGCAGCGCALYFKGTEAEITSQG